MWKLRKYSHFTQQHRENMSKARKEYLRKHPRKGVDASFYGRHHSDETKKKLSKSKQGMNHPFYGKKRPEHSKIMSGRGNPMYGKHRSSDVKRRISQTKKLKFQLDPDYGKISSEGRQNILRGLIKKPTKPEKTLINIIKKYTVAYRYTGDGSFILAGLNPDFIHNNGEKIAVEVFGDYWHSPLLRPNIPFHQTLQGRREFFKKHGWKLVVFWESELKKPNVETLVLRRLRVD